MSQQQPAITTCGNLDDDLRKKIECYSYRLGDRIGQGYSSVVYRGHHDETKEPVAVKVVDLRSLKDATAHDLLRSEISVVKKLRHPNLLRCHSVLMTVNNCYIVTEYCGGGDLATFLKRRGRLCEKEVIAIIRDVVNGYLELASRNILHRDIKPANILIAEGNYRIADFGFAKFDREPGQREKYQVGTPLYMSPQALKLHIYSTKNDIWSMGVMFYELLHGCTPWLNCRTEKDLLQKMLSQRAEFKVKVAKELEEFIMGCLEVEERKRLDTHQIAELLTKVLEKENCHRHLDLPSKEQEFRNEPLLKTCINLNRVLFKLYPRFERMECQPNLKATILSFLVNWLNLGVNNLHRITCDREAAEQFGLRGYDHYVTTSQWRRISQVIGEYHQKYTGFVEERLPQMSFHAQSLEQLFEVWLPQFGRAIAQLILEGDEQYIIAVDYLVSLAQLADLLWEYPLAALSDHLKLEPLMEVTPTPLCADDLQELMFRRATILSPYV